MPISLSTLQIPDVSVVPEPTAGEVDCVLETARIAILNGGPTALTLDERCVIGLSRRCRELEAENKEHWPSSDPTSHQKRDVLYQLCKRIISDKQNQWLSEAAIETIETLEAEVERLKRNIETVVEYMDTGEGSFPENWNIRDHLKGALDGN